MTDQTGINMKGLLRGLRTEILFYSRDIFFVYNLVENQLFKMADVRELSWLYVFESDSVFIAILISNIKFLGF